MSFPGEVTLAMLAYTMQFRPICSYEESAKLTYIVNIHEFFITSGCVLWVSGHSEFMAGRDFDL